MVLHQRRFIEAVIDEVREAKDLLLPTLMVEAPDAPWTAASIERLRQALDGLEAPMRRAAELLLAFELPFVEHEEALAAAGRHAGGPTWRASRWRWSTSSAPSGTSATRRTGRTRSAGGPRERPNYDVCETHRLDSDRVRRAIRDHGATSFDDIAPLLGTSPTCATCHVGVTRLLIQEVRRAKGQAG
jgi:bacterioferritin-associated ferredoxin